MLRLGIVAVLLLCGGAYLAAQGRTASPRPVQHTCGLTDRQFLSNYGLQLEEVGMYGDDYLHGDAEATDLIDVATGAAAIVRSSAPFDPTLQVVRKYAPAMFLSYADAISAQVAGKSSSKEMYRAYSIGARVRDILREAQPGLAAAGCDVSNLLQ